MASRTTTDPIEILLEMGVDLDNLSEEEDYLSALMEAINTLSIKNASDPRIEFLADEIKKVRTKRKAADPKFKARKTKISADSFKKGSATTASIGQKALPSSIKPKTSIIPYVKPEEVDEEEKGSKKKKARTRKTDKDKKLLEKIAKSVSNIADILKEQYGLKKKKAAYDRKKAEADQRKLKESNLEKSFKGLASAAEKVIAPVKNALDSIFDFFLNIIIGRFLVKFIGWFGDPKNKEKVDSVVRFLVDHGPKLLAAFLLFGTSIGRFAVRLSAVLLKGALSLGAAAAKFALRFAMANPAAAAITTIVGGATLGAISQANTQSNDPDAPEGRTQLEDTMDYGGVTGDPIAGAFQYGGTVPYYNDGGGVSSGKITTNSGSDITGAGPDTQLIAAQPGEIVINKKTVDAVGSEHFLGLNQQYGGPGANKPKTAKVQTASDGGFVLPTFSSGGVVSVSHPNTGSGYGVDGVTDYKGRPGVFSKGAATAFGKMITDSGGAVKGSDIASSQRSKSYNRKVGGVSNSNHLYGNALDIHGTSQTWMRANGSKYGWIVNDYPGSHGGHFNYKGAGASQMNTPDEGSPVTGQGGRSLGSTTQRGGTGLRSGGPNVTVKSSIVLALKNGIQGKLNTATGKFTPSEFTKAERARYTKSGGTIPEVKPKRSDFPMGRAGGKAYSEALKKHQSGDSTTAQPASSSITPTGKVVGRDKLSPRAQKALARMDAQKGLPPDMQYTRNGRKISAKDFNRTKNIISAAKEGGIKGVLNHMISGVKGMFGGIFGGLQGAVNDPRSFVESMGGTVKDGNIGTPTAQEQKDIDALDAKKAKLRATEAKLGTMGKDLVTPGPPPGGGSNVKVIRIPSSGGGDNPVDRDTGGSDVNAASTGNGNKAKWNILGIPMPF